jgi:hypothetical protein
MRGLPLLRPEGTWAAVPVKIEQLATAPWLTPFRLRPSEAVLVILLNPNVGRFVNEDGEVVVSHGPGRRQ